jgi:site-specific DNA recombinase
MNQILAVDKNRVATYIRWSTDEQTDGTTLEVQLEACRLFIQSQGWTFRDDLVFVDDGYSGSSLERPGLSRLRHAVSEGVISCVVVYKLDRLSRSVLDTVNLVLKEWEGVCSVRSTREPVDTTNPAGSILFYMLASYAEWERSTIRERTFSGKVKRAQQGRNPGFPPPYGYTRGPEPGQFAVYEPEAVVVRRIFREYMSGKGIHTIALGLNLDGIKPRRADRWRGETIIKMINNHIYMGVLRYGMSTLTTPAQRKQLKKFRVFFDEPRLANVSGVVEAIVSPEDFDRVQRVKASRNSTVGCRARGSDFLLTGIARCKCGATIRGDGRTKVKRYYRCGGAQTSNPHRCDCGLINAYKLDALVLAKVREALAPENRALLMATWNEDNAAKMAVVLDELRQVQANLAQVEKTRSRFTADYKAGDLPAKLYAAHCEDLDRDEERLKATLAALVEERNRLEAGRCDISEFDHVSSQLDSWEMLSPEEQKQALRHALERCVVYRRSGAGHGDKSPVEVDLQIRQLGS